MTHIYHTARIPRVFHISGHAEFVSVTVGAFVEEEPLVWTPKTFKSTAIGPYADPHHEILGCEHVAMVWKQNPKGPSTQLKGIYPKP